MTSGLVPIGEQTTLVSAIGTGDTSFDVEDASVFPAPYGYPIRIIHGTDTEDVVLGDVPTGDTLAVTRSGSPIAFPAGAVVRWTFNPGDSLGGGGGGGGVSGPGTTTDRAIATWSGTGGTALRNNAPLIASDGRITTLTDPSGTQDAATKAYADAGDVATLGSAEGYADLLLHRVRLCTVAALPAYSRSTNTITASANGALSVDGTAVAVGDRILLKDGAAGADNGIWSVTAAGSGGAPFVLDRAADANASTDFLPGQIVSVYAGATLAGTAWYFATTAAFTLNTTTATYTVLVGPRGSAGQAQYKSGDAFAGAARLLIDNNGLPKVGELTGTSVPTTPGAGEGIALWSRLRAGKSTLRLKDAAGMDTGLQPHLITKPFVYLPQGMASSGIDGFGSFQTVSATAAGSGAPLTASLVGQQRRMRHSSTTAANANAGFRVPGSNTGYFFRSLTTGVGGVHAIIRLVMNQNRTNQRFFCGFWASLGSLITADPSGLTNIAGFMLDSGQTTMRWGVNDASGTVDDGLGGGGPHDLGASFPLNTNDTDLFELQIQWSVGPALEIRWSAESMTTGAFEEDVSTSNLPVVDTLLQFYLIAALGATTGSAERMDVVSVVIHTDY